MTPAITAMLDFLRDERALKKHVEDAAIAMQIEWAPDRDEWLERCERLRQARDQIAAVVSVVG